MVLTMSGAIKSQSARFSYDVWVDCRYVPAEVVEDSSVYADALRRISLARRTHLRIPSCSQASLQSSA
jgi:hypothetical protein